MPLFISIREDVIYQEFVRHTEEDAIGNLGAGNWVEEVAIGEVTNLGVEFKKGVTFNTDMLFALARVVEKHSVSRDEDVMICYT